jgi:hypothetical protein
LNKGRKAGIPEVVVRLGKGGEEIEKEYTAHGTWDPRKSIELSAAKK